MTKFVAITRQLSSTVWRFEDRDFNIDTFGIGTALYCRLGFSAETRQGWAF